LKLELILEPGFSGLKLISKMRLAKVDDVQDSCYYR